ncbi:MAG: hypothetical protein DWQ05_02475 [Calditrichaeota bacterium]|nr:MAG: hypothetical protein DWQ05_02475 [Calditrichota bacterium]
MSKSSSYFISIVSIFLFNIPLVAQSLFLEQSEQALATEIWGKGINPGFYYERAFLPSIIENFSISVGVSSFFMKQGDSHLDLSFPTWSSSFHKYKSIGDASWTYLEFGFSIYHKRVGSAIFPAWAAGYCLAPMDNSFFLKLGLTSVQLLPYFQFQVGWRF